MRFKQPFSVFRRSRHQGAPVFFYRVYDPTTGKRREFSTGMGSKAKAMAFCQDLYERGELLPPDNEPKVVLSIPSGSMAFREFATGWFGKDCEFLRWRVRARKPLARTTIALHEIRLRCQILPHFGQTPLSAISVAGIEDWFYGIDAKARVRNSALQTLRLMLRDAMRRGLIHNNPAMAVTYEHEDDKVREIYTQSEIFKLFFKDGNVEKVWGGDSRLRLACFLAANTGMRAGEIQGLQVASLQGNPEEAWVMVEHSWDEVELKPTKSTKPRLSPISPELLEDLRTSGLEAGFVFSMDGGKTPVKYDYLYDGLQAALAAVGIPVAMQKARGLGLHAFRYWFNTSLKGKVADSVIRAAIGHMSQGMTDHYTAHPREDLKPIANIIRGVFDMTQKRAAK